MNNESLGRGLGALIPGAAKSGGQYSVTGAAEQNGQGILKIGLDKIKSNPYQPRTSFDQDQLAELAASIRQYGILQPLVVSPGSGDTFQLIAGERRLQAARLADLKEVPVMVRKVEDQEKLELALVENIQRQNL